MIRLIFITLLLSGCATNETKRRMIMDMYPGCQVDDSGELVCPSPFEEQQDVRREESGSDSITEDGLAE